MLASGLLAGALLVAEGFAVVGEAGDGGVDARRDWPASSAGRAPGYPVARYRWVRGGRTPGTGRRPVRSGARVDPGCGRLPAASRPEFRSRVHLEERAVGECAVCWSREGMTGAALRLRGSAWPAGLLLGLGAEWLARPGQSLAAAGADLAVGWTLIGCGLVDWSRRPQSRVGPLLVLTGSACFSVRWLARGSGLLRRSARRCFSCTAARCARRSLATRAGGPWAGWASSQWWCATCTRRPSRLPAAAC